MPLTEDFERELNEAAQAAYDEEIGEPADESTDAKPVDDVGAETVEGEAGDIDDAVSDVPDSSGDETGSAGGGGEDTDVVTAEPVTAEPATPAISNAVLEEAIRCGLTLEAAQKFPSDQALFRVVQTLKQRLEQTPLPEPKKEAEPEEDILAPFVALDTEQFEPEVAKVLDIVKGVMQKQQEEIRGLREQTLAYNQEASQQNERALQQEIVAWFDGRVASLGDGFKDVLGVGGTEALDPFSEHARKRDELMNHVAATVNGWRSVGKEIPRDEAFKQAAKIVLADQYAKIEAEKRESQTTKRKRHQIQRASGTARAKTTDIDELAVEALAKLGLEG